MTEACVCWKCGGALPELLLPLPRHEACPHCRASLHVCRMCRLFDPAVAQQCREPVADPVSDKQRANFCGYFEINPRAFVAAPVRDGKAQLDALFGDKTAGTSGQPGENAALQESPEDLFRK